MQRVLANIKKGGFRCPQATISSHRSWPQHRSSTRTTTTGVRRFRGPGPPPAPPLSLSPRAFLMSLWTRATTRRMVKGFLVRTRHTHNGEHVAESICCGHQQHMSCAGPLARTFREKTSTHRSCYTLASALLSQLFAHIFPTTHASTYRSAIVRSAAPRASIHTVRRSLPA